MLSLVGAIGLASCGAAFTANDNGVDGASGAAGASSGSGGSVDSGEDASNSGAVVTAGPGGMAGSGVTAGSGGSAGSHGGASNGSDAFVEADTRPPVDASSPADSGGEGSTGAGDAGKDGIFCGSTRCNPASQVCCAEIGALDPLSTLPLRCVPKGMCSGTSPMNIPCDDHADCAISSPTLPICCVGTTFGMPNGQFILDECTIPSGCVTNANVRHAYMCSGPDDTTSCPPGTACKPGQLRQGYFTCQ